MVFYRSAARIRYLDSCSFGWADYRPADRQETALRQSSGALLKNRPRPCKTFQQTMLRGSIVMLSVGNPSAAGTQRRQALQECPVMLAGTTGRGINRKWWSVAAMLDTAAFLSGEIAFG
jgi:hypothetical protein